MMGMDIVRFQHGVGQKLDGVDPKLFGRLVRNTKKQTDLGWLGGHSFKLSFNLVTGGFPPDMGRGH